VNLEPNFEKCRSSFEKTDLPQTLFENLSVLSEISNCVGLFGAVWRGLQRIGITEKLNVGLVIRKSRRVIHGMDLFLGVLLGFPPEIAVVVGCVGGDPLPSDVHIQVDVGPGTGRHLRCDQPNREADRFEHRSEKDRVIVTIGVGNPFFPEPN